MKREFIHPMKNNKMELNILDTFKKEESVLLTGRGQCLIGGCACKGFKGGGPSICSECGHYYNDHQDIG